MEISSKLKICRICKRDSFTLELKKCGKFDVCSTCKNHFYTYFNKLFLKIVKSVDLQSVGPVTLECPLFLEIWSFLDQPGNCQTKSRFENLTKICDIDYRSVPVRNCTKCRFRWGILLFKVPNTKSTIIYKDEFMIFSRAWPALKRLIVAKCDNLEKELERQVSLVQKPLYITKEADLNLEMRSTVHPIQALNWMFLQVHITDTKDYLLKSPARTMATEIYYFDDSTNTTTQIPRKKVYSCFSNLALSTHMKTQADYISSSEEFGTSCDEYLEICYKYFIEHKNFFVSILSNLLSNTAAHIPDWDGGNNPDFFEKISQKVYFNTFMVIPYLSTFASFKNGYYYYVPLGAYKRSLKSFYCHLQEFYGFDRGQVVFELSNKVSNILSNYPRFKLTFALLKGMVVFLLETNSKLDFLQKLVGHEQILLGTLHLHMNKMEENFGMTEDMKLIEYLMRLDLNRVIKLRFRLEQYNCISTI